MGEIFKAIGNIFSSIFGDEPTPQAAAPAAAPPPVIAPPTPMPIPDDAAVAASRKRSIAAQMQRSGRQSTLLTSDPVTGDPLG